MPKAKTSI
jgi:hypothetical protein